jgi:hypothetical protein
VLLAIESSVEPPRELNDCLSIAVAPDLVHLRTPLAGVGLLTAR